MNNLKTGQLPPKKKQRSFESDSTEEDVKLNTRNNSLLSTTINESIT